MTRRFPEDRPARIAALVDLPRSAAAGGHVKYWERLAAAAASVDFPFDLTVYFSGDRPDEILAPHVQLRHLRPVFSTSRLAFLPYVPDHTDLAPFHPRLARELGRYDLLHTSDGFFAFARTAERIARARGLPLTTSFHTDTPAYARIFTRQTIDALCGRWPWLRRKLVETWSVPERQGAKMQRRLESHLRRASLAFATRPEDRRLAERILGPAGVSRLRIGVDTAEFGPHRRDVARVRRDYAIPEGRIVVLFVGRVDVGKNAPTLVEAVARAIAAGARLHLVVAGVGPMTGELARRLTGHVSLPGFVAPSDLARLYASVDLVALPSEVEIGGMAALEAVASGCPTLIAAAGGSARLFDPTAALRVLDGDVESWAAALTELASDEGRRAAMRRAAIGYAAERLTNWRAVLEEDLAPGWRAALAGVAKGRRR